MRASTSPSVIASRYLVLGALLLAATPLQAQWQPQVSNTPASLRGLSVVSATVAWASGSGGTVIRTVDGGRTWRADTIPGATRFDLRAIAAIDDQTAVVAATAGRIWRTENGGRSWTLVYENPDSAVFLDAVAFFEPRGGERRGLVLGDPIEGRFYVLTTTDGGRTWREAPRESRPVAQPGEGAFAASGSSLVTHGVRHAWIGTGVNVGRVLRTSDGGATWSAVQTPLSTASQAAGIFSLSFADTLFGIAVGGDYEKPDGRERTVAVTRDGGATWQVPDGTPPMGFRSAVAIVPQTNGRVAIAVGTNGTDLSVDSGANWARIDTVGYHAVRFAANGTGWATGGRGRVARYEPDVTRKP